MRGFIAPLTELAGCQGLGAGRTKTCGDVYADPIYPRVRALKHLETRVSSMQSPYCKMRGSDLGLVHGNILQSVLLATPRESLIEPSTSIYIRLFDESCKCFKRFRRAKVDLDALSNEEDIPLAELVFSAISFQRSFAFCHDHDAWPAHFSDSL